jgi:signal recognition particle receptor subunit beta
MRSAKIIVTGPGRAGTTTFIRSLSEIAVLSTERKLGHPAEQGRGEATVSLDFGRVTINRDLVLYLFGTPGDEPNSLTEGPLAEGPIGLIVTLDASRPRSIEGAAEIVAFLEENADVPYVVAANRLAQGDEHRLSAVRAAVHAPKDVPVVACEVTERESAKRVVLALIDRILDMTAPDASLDTADEAEAE